MGIGNMYKWVTKTFNPVAGVCPHGCSYCFVNTLKRRNKVLRNKYNGDIRLVEHELKRNLGKGNVWFVCSCMDLFAEVVPLYIIEKVLEHCREYPDNTYLFQSKNPKRFMDIDTVWFPQNTILGTTIETNRDTSGISKAPITFDRYLGIKHAGYYKSLDVMVSIEPILDFDVSKMVNWMRDIKPKFVSIGADSKNHNLPEPPAWKVEQLIKSLKEFTEVKIKDNLSRILEVK